MNQPENGIIAERAIVTPRGFRVGSEARLPLEQLIRPYVRKDCRGVIFITGPCGSGKTTALSHLKSIFGDLNYLAYLDEPQLDHWVGFGQHGLALVAMSGESPVHARLVFQLSPWTQDDCIEYLAVRHRAQCDSVMQRLIADAPLDALEGSPRLLRIILDNMAGDQSVETSSEALLQHLWGLLPTESARSGALAACFDAMCTPEAALALRSAAFIPQGLAPLVRHRQVLMKLAAYGFVQQLFRKRPMTFLNTLQKPSIIREFGDAVRCTADAARRLNALVEKPDGCSEATAASILLAADPDWRPATGTRLRLDHALLPDAKWDRLDLSRASLTEAKLSGASLNHCMLDRILAKGANFARASLGHASLNRAELESADFSGANLAYAIIENANLMDTDFARAYLGHACLKGCNLFGTSFASAIVIHADLSNASLTGIHPGDADFSHAKLDGATVFHVPMKLADWRWASFRKARFSGCDFSGLSLPEPDFCGADLTGCDFTGTRMPGAKFQAAVLQNTGLAQIEWENADLREADFTNASFHMGSTRSGLVGSVIPCEGSKTGFYTDEFNEQDFKAPEEIRKANLCGANLLGAKVTGTDWYLVDLRGATYSQEQAEHFARCGAILRAHVS